jgi:glucose-6-phosphate 1-epimerase
VLRHVIVASSVPTHRCQRYRNIEPGLGAARRWWRSIYVFVMTSASALPATIHDVVAVSGTDGSAALVSLRGGHVVSWRTADGVERLFVSQLATNADGASIRGGIPVCFPQFAALGSLRKHGFARTSLWEQRTATRFAISVGPDSWPGWPHHCTLLLDVLLGPSTLTLTLQVTNEGAGSLSFTGALHTYLSCADVTAVAVEGLDGCATHAGGVVAGAITFAGVDDVDLVALSATQPVVVRGIDAAAPLAVLCAQTGFRDVVVWNVGATLGAAMSDLGDGQWREYVCIEAAAAGEPITVPAGTTWVGSQTLVVLA